MNQSRPKLKIGVLGAGNVAKDLHLPVLTNIPEVKIEWICDKDEQRARKLGKLFGIGVVYNDIKKCSDVDIVLVAIPIGLRQEVMDVIFHRGWHVFCEKPFALNLAEHDRYLAEAHKNNVQIGVGLVRRYGSATVSAKKILGGEHFGLVTRIWASHGVMTKRTGQESGWYGGDPRAVGGGVLMETGSHLVDQICTILDVNGFRLDRCTQWKFNGLEFETNFVGMVSNEQQCDIPCAFEVSRLRDLCSGIFIQFSRIILKCGLFFEDPLELLALDGSHIARFDLDGGAKTIAQAFSLEWQDFIDQCTSGNASPVSADTARQSTAIIEECYAKAQILGATDVGEIRKSG